MDVVYDCNIVFIASQMEVNGIISFEKKQIMDYIEYNQVVSTNNITMNKKRKFSIIKILSINRGD